MGTVSRSSFLSVATSKDTQDKCVADARTIVLKGERSIHKTIKFSDMRGEFDSLQFPPPGASLMHRRGLKKTGRLKVISTDRAVYSSFSIASAISFTVFSANGFLRLPTFRRSK